MRSHSRSVAKFALLRPLPYLRPQGSALGCSPGDTQNPRALTSWGSPPYQISAELLGLQTPQVVPSPSLLPPPTIPRFLAATSWQTYLASVHPLGPWVLLRTAVVTVQPACQSPTCCLSRAPVARLTAVRLALIWSCCWDHGGASTAQATPHLPPHQPTHVSTLCLLVTHGPQTLRPPWFLSEFSSLPWFSSPCRLCPLGSLRLECPLPKLFACQTPQF